MAAAGERKYQKSYFDVLGLCCTSEVPMVEKILKSLDGVLTVSVIVPSRTVIVVHDSLLISQLQIVKVLNQAKLEATIRAYGGGATIKNWPSPYTMACFILLALSFLGPFYRPMHWLALGAVAIGIPPVIKRAVASIFRFRVDINVLMLIAVAGSIALKDYWEAGTIVFLFTLSDWLNSRASYKATAVMASLMNLIPQKAVLAQSDTVVDARDVKENTLLAVKAGEVVPIDGVVVEGSCEIDESSLTGESFPVPKHQESFVWAGTHSLNGYIIFKTTALAENSAVAKMTKLVEEAQNSKSRMHRVIDSCASYYTPAVIIASAAVAIVPAIMRLHNRTYYFQLALVLLVSACPCALVLSTPVATFCALSKAAMTGFLIKGGDFLEILAKTKVVAFDKTGTLTRGEFSVIDFRSFKNDVSMDLLLYWVSSIESKSSHPMSASLIDHAHSNSIEPKPDHVSNFQTFPGEGVCGEINGKMVYVGNLRISRRAGCEAVPAIVGETKGVTMGYVFLASEPVGWFSLSDTCRTGAVEAINDLKGLHAKIVMLTGDSYLAASHVQMQVGGSIDRVHSELLPEDKVSLIKELRSQEGATVMVGDGMNDAPALTAADVGISMGISGSSVAMETSHITMMSNDMRKIPGAIRLARRTRWKIIQNIVLSISTKAFVLALAFAGHPILWAAVLVDVGACLLVVLNSMTLLHQTKHKGKKCCSSSHRNHQSGSNGRKFHSHSHRGSEDHCHKYHSGHDNMEDPSQKSHHEHIHFGATDQHLNSPGGICCKKESCQANHAKLLEVVENEKCKSNRTFGISTSCCRNSPSQVIHEHCHVQDSGFEHVENSHAVHIASEATEREFGHNADCENCSKEQALIQDLHNGERGGCCKTCRDEHGEVSCSGKDICPLSEIIAE